MAASYVRWQLLKDYLVDHGVSGISGSRDAEREAVVRELLPAGSEDTWMAMIRHPGLLDHIDRVGITPATPRPASGQGQDVGALR